MSNPNNTFECRWQPSPWLLRGYLVAAVLAVAAAFLLALPGLLRLLLVLGLLGYLSWSLPRQVLLSHPSAISGLRQGARGWAVFSRAAGWQPVRLQRDCVVLPWLVILRVRAPGQRWSRSACIPADALEGNVHRRLRVHLRFARGRFAPPATNA